MVVSTFDNYSLSLHDDRTQSMMVSAVVFRVYNSKYNNCPEDDNKFLVETLTQTL